MAYSARSMSTDSLTKLVFQLAHGFTVGQIVVSNGTALVLSKADNLADCQGSMMVSIVVDVNSFYVTQTGWVSGLPITYIPGTQYYVSPSSAGNLTSTMPSSSGNIILSCFVADTTASGYFYTSSGFEIESGPLFNWTTATSNTNMGVNQGYFTFSVITLHMTLPPVANIGDVIRISNLKGNFSVLTNVGQTINFGNDIVSTGITSNAVGDTLELICYLATPVPLFQVLSCMGNLTYV